MIIMGVVVGVFSATDVVGLAVVYGTRQADYYVCL
jgi:hypothetical protein